MIRGPADIHPLYSILYFILFYIVTPRYIERERVHWNTVNVGVVLYTYRSINNRLAGSLYQSDVSDLQV